MAKRQQTFQRAARKRKAQQRLKAAIARQQQDGAEDTQEPQTEPEAKPAKSKKHAEPAEA